MAGKDLKGMIRRARLRNPDGREGFKGEDSEGQLCSNLALYTRHEAGCVAGWLVVWLAGWLAVWLAGWLAVWLAGWLAGCVAGLQNKVVVYESLPKNNSFVEGTGFHTGPVDLPGFPR